MFGKKKEKEMKSNYIPPEKTIFDGTNEEVMLAFGKIAEDIKEILTDDEFPNMLISPDSVNPNATKKELGELYIREKVGQRFYSLIKTLVVKKPDNIYNILDTLFCVPRGTYKNRAFKDTIQDFKLLTNENMRDLLRLFM